MEYFQVCSIGSFFQALNIGWGYQMRTRFLVLATIRWEEQTFSSILEELVRDNPNETRSDLLLTRPGKHYR